MFTIIITTFSREFFGEVATFSREFLGEVATFSREFAIIKAVSGRLQGGLGGVWGGFNA